MFDFVHEKKRLVQVVLALIVLPFALWGVDSYRKSGDGESLASVNGEKIGQQEFDNAMDQQRQRMREMAGPFRSDLFEKPEVKHSVLEGLVAQHLLGLEARKAGLVVTDEVLAEVIAGIGAFQKDGKFDKQLAERLLKEQSMTPLMFESRVRQELSSRQLTDAYTQNGYTSSFIADKLIRLNEQQRVVALAKFDVDAMLAQVKVADAAVAEYYKNNQSEFQTPERARVEYVVFSADSLLPQVTPVSRDQNLLRGTQSEFGTQEQRQAAHILIALPAGAAMQINRRPKQRPSKCCKKSSIAR